MVAERVDDRAAEEIEAAADFGDQRALHLRVVAERGQRRTSAGRTNSACSVCSAASSVGVKRRVGMLLEPAIGDLAHAVVAVAEQRRASGRACRDR